MNSQKSFIIIWLTFITLNYNLIHFGGLVGAARLEVFNKSSTCEVYHSHIYRQHNTPNFYCYLREERLKWFDELTGSYKIQKYAIETIRKALIRKIAKPSDRVVILSTGDHGLGKTASARLLSKAMFVASRNEFEGDGLLLVHGENYKRVKASDDKGITNARSELYKMISDQLGKCPQSVILIDEIQKIHPSVLSVLEPFFEGLAINRMVTNQAIYILTSDFEKEGVTSQRSYEEIIALINSFSKTIYRDTKIMNLVTDIAPFKSLSRVEVEAALLDKMKEMYCLDLFPLGLRDMQLHDVKAIQTFLADMMDRLYMNENYRGIEKVLKTFIQNDIQQHLVSHSDHYQNSNVVSSDWFSKTWEDTFCSATIKLKSPTQLAIEYNDISEKHIGNVFSFITRNLNFPGANNK